MTNARCLTEGVNVPAIDCVMFADPKQSRIDIVQAAGRALRRYRGKELGYIVIPLVVPAKMDFEAFAETTAFRRVAQTISALSTQDERIADEFRAIERGRISSGKIVEIEPDVAVGMKMNLGEFAEAISTRIWEYVGRANWRKFEEAGSFARSLKLKSTEAWRAYARSERRPPDIPAAPNETYKKSGWIGFGDWLGTGRQSDWYRRFREFSEARTFVQNLGLENLDEWRAYCASGKLPPDIPSNPQRTYADHGWVGMGDWLGSGKASNRYRKFQLFRRARGFVRKLGLKSGNEWRAYCASGKLPPDIPSNPHRTYADHGWVGMGDWLGTGTIASHLRQYRPFKNACAFARSLKLKSGAEWRAYCQSGKLPPDIPANPYETYADKGWSGMGHWLGTGIIAPRLRRYRTFKSARTFARKLQLKSSKEWFAYCRSGAKPADIPAQPSQTYANGGWAGYGDWLGTGTVSTRNRKCRSFERARAFARSLGLKSQTEWAAYCKSGKKPEDIPQSPHEVYAGAGWIGLGDWLGTGRVASRFHKYRSFVSARAFVHGLCLKSSTEWKAYCKSGKKPADIPAKPDNGYANKGWAGYSDWLGNGRVVRGSKSILEEGPSVPVQPPA
jgi:hypothetical protein